MQSSNTKISGRSVASTRGELRATEQSQHQSKSQPPLLSLLLARNYYFDLHKTHIYLKKITLHFWLPNDTRLLCSFYLQCHTDFVYFEEWDTWVRKCRHKQCVTQCSNIFYFMTTYGMPTPIWQVILINLEQASAVEQHYTTYDTRNCEWNISIYLLLSASKKYVLKHDWHALSI